MGRDKSTPEALSKASKDREIFGFMTYACVTTASGCYFRKTQTGSLTIISWTACGTLTGNLTFSRQYHLGLITVYHQSWVSKRHGWGGWACRHSFPHANIFLTSLCWVVLEINIRYHKMPRFHLQKGRPLVLGGLTPIDATSRQSTHLATTQAVWETQTHPNHM